MKSKILWVIFIFFLLVLLGISTHIFYKTNVFNLIFSQHPSNKAKMTKEEYKIFKEYRKAIAEGNLEKINNFIAIDPEKINFDIKVLKSNSIGNYKVIEVHISNEGDSPIILLPMRLRQVSQAYMKENIKYIDYALDSIPFEARYIKVLKTAKAVKQNFELTNFDFSVSKCIIYFGLPDRVEKNNGRYSVLLNTVKTFQLEIPKERDQ